VRVATVLGTGGSAASFAAPSGPGFAPTAGTVPLQRFHSYQEQPGPLGPVAVVCRSTTAPGRAVSPMHFAAQQSIPGLPAPAGKEPIASGVQEVLTPGVGQQPPGRAGGIAAVPSMTQCRSLSPHRSTSSAQAAPIIVTAPPVVKAELSSNGRSLSPPRQRQGSLVPPQLAQVSGGTQPAPLTTLRRMHSPYRTRPFVYAPCLAATPPQSVAVRAAPPVMPQTSAVVAACPPQRLATTVTVAGQPFATPPLSMAGAATGGNLQGPGQTLVEVLALTRSQSVDSGISC